MNQGFRILSRGVAGALVAASLLAGCSGMMMGSSSATLTGKNEVPPNASAATAVSTIAIAADRTVSGTIVATGMTATAAHIHEGAAGANGPVIVPFTKTADNTFAPPAGAKVTDAQYATYKAGGLYVNVHSAAFPGGEIRVQLQP